MGRPMLKPPHVRARQRFIRRYSGPALACVIVCTGFFLFWPG